MVETLAKNWWAVLLRGIFAILFGVLAIITPFAAGLALVFLFGAYALVDGIFALIGAVRAAEAHARWWPFVIEGIVGIAVAALTFYHPLAVGLGLYWLIAAWAIVTGILEIMAAFQLRRVVVNEVFLVLSGVISIVFGVILFILPAIGSALAGFLSVIWLIGIYAILFGIFFIVLSFRLRSLRKPSTT